MGLKKVSKLIGKINVLHDSLLSIDEEISSIEKDLLLNYIRQLYEQVLEIGTEDAPLQMPPLAKKVMDLPKSEKVVIEASVPEISDTPIAQEEPSAKEVVEKVQNIEKVAVEMEEKTIEHTDLSMDGIDAELMSMFEIKEAKELSEKLSSLPIKDLSTAMGINDRFLTVNELFGGDSDAFKTCVDKVNKMETYDHAKSYLLANIAQKYEWSSADKIKKAAGFISLVQRRFR